VLVYVLCARACCTFKPLESFSRAWRSPLAGIPRFFELALALFREASLQAPLTRLGVPCVVPGAVQREFELGGSLKLELGCVRVLQR